MSNPLIKIICHGRYEATVDNFQSMHKINPFLSMSPNIQFRTKKPLKITNYVYYKDIQLLNLRQFINFNISWILKYVIYNYNSNKLHCSKSQIWTSAATIEQFDNETTDRGVILP